MSGVSSRVQSHQLLTSGAYTAAERLSWTACCRELTKWLRDQDRLRTPGLFVQSADAALHPGASGGAWNQGISSHLMSQGGGQAIRKIRHALDQGLSVRLFPVCSTAVIHRSSFSIFLVSVQHSGCSANHTPSHALPPASIWLHIQRRLMDAFSIK